MIGNSPSDGYCNAVRLYDWLHLCGQRLESRFGLLRDPVRDRTAQAANVRHLSRSELGSLFFEHRGRIIHKWVHYLDLYDRHFAPYRDGPLRMLEIGVSLGGSLELWRKYFGPDAVIYGIDVDPECASRFDPPNEVRIGSQADPEFLRCVIEEMGGVDIVIDDGSHIAGHQLTSFRTLFPLLSVGGLYVIEDTHTAYWPGVHGGGYGRRNTAIHLAKSLLDDVNRWWHDRPAREVGAVHAYDSIVFIEKARAAEPRVVRVPD